MKITWIGHSCVKVEKNGYAIVIDPYKDGSVPGLKPISEQADMVLCSHEHSDHNYREGVKIVKSAAEPLQVSVINSYHDDAKGALRGPNKIHILTDGTKRIAHLGDLGCMLEEKQLAELKNVDVLLIPVGGYYTIDAKQAYELCKAIDPKVIVPMHYRDDVKGFGYDVIAPKDEFIKFMKDVETVRSSTLDTLDKIDAQTIILEPQNID